VITIEVNGANYNGLKSSSVFLSMETVSGSFTIVTTVDPDNSFPLKKGSECKILVDRVVVMTGVIEKINPSWSGDDHTISVTGRDKISDLIDCTVGDVKKIETPTSLETMCRMVMDGVGLNDLKVINNAGTIPAFDASEKITAEVGQKAFKFLESYARKRQVLLTRDSDSNLVLTRNSNDILKTKILNVIGGNNNNVTTGSGIDDDSNRFYKYIVRSQANPSATGYAGTDEDIAGVVGIAFDDDIRKNRVLEINAEQSMDKPACEKRAQWEANIRRARAISAKYVIPGHSANGEVWRENRRVDVVDDFNDLRAQMTIKNVRFGYDLGGGSITTVSLSPPDAFELSPTQPGASKKNDDIFAKFSQSADEASKLTPLDVKLRL